MRDDRALVIATDASVVAAMGAAAWAASDGRTGVADASADVLAAELEAIALALDAAQPGIPLRVRADSTAALAALRRARTQGRRPSGPAVAAALDLALDALDRAGSRLAPHGIRLEHVRAHRGDPLNEAAHALAFERASRRAGREGGRRGRS